VVGAVLVNFGKSWLTGAFPEVWLFVLGALFVLTTLVFPHGIVGLFRHLRRAAPQQPKPLPVEEQA
jgi:urea transport system permease protein